MKLKGIDVSHHQGTINWEEVKSSGIEFAIIRVGYSNRNGKGGLNFDKRYAYNIRECNRLGIPIGVYIYCYDRTPYAATITTKAFIKAIKGYKIEYPVIYDIEYDNKDLSKTVNTAIVNAAMKVIEDAGYYGMVYASKDFFINHLNMADLAQTDKWEAAYSSTDNGPVVNGMWQYTSKGTVPGIVGNVDLDYSYKDYPSIIKKAGLNGFFVPTKRDTEVVKAESSIKETTNAETATTATTQAPALATNVAAPKSVVCNKLNVRKGPGTNYGVVRIIHKGDLVPVIKEQNGWTKISAVSEEWVNNKFIK